MSGLSKAQENYIEHEVQLRVHDAKFQNLDKSIDRLDASIKHLDNKIDSSIKHLDNKLTWSVGIFIAISIIGWITPIALHFIKV